MIKASEVRAMMKDAFGGIKNSEEFKYVMQKLEFDITEAANNGKFEIRFNFHAMEDQHGNWPSDALRRAVASELEANGYRYWEYTITAPNGNINSCFGICW